jgi:hypothetical protein
MCTGERGLLQRFAGVVWAREGVEPQYVVPNGGEVVLDTGRRSLEVRY